MVWSISHLAFAAASSAAMFGFDAGVDTLTSRMTGTSFVTSTIFSTGFPTSSSSEIRFEDFYIELFEDAAGNYFTVLYQLSGCQHHTITPVSARAAQQFLERFGSRA